jgi:hypothetical protein
MRKLIMVWFLGSLIVTAGLAYVHFSRPAAPQPGSHARSLEAPVGAARDTAAPAGAAGEVQAPASNSGEQLALVFSIGSSIISAIAALAQTWLTHRAFKASR